MGALEPLCVTVMVLCTQIMVVCEPVVLCMVGVLCIPVCGS